MSGVGGRVALDTISLPGFGSYSAVGTPALPCKLIYVALPPNADLSTVDVASTELTTSLLCGVYEIAPIPPAVPADRSHPDNHITRDLNVYGRNAFFPDRHLRVRRVGRLRNLNVAVLEYWPYCYNPVSGAIRAVTSAAVDLTYSRSASADFDYAPVPSEFAGLVLNAGQVRDWCPASDGPPPGYAIITTSAIASASQELPHFVSALSARGFRPIVATEDEWGGGTGDAAAEHIRQWLGSRYLALRLEYALLIGDPNPATGDVPMKMLWPRSGQSSYREAPSDFYYSDLSGNWDLDCDGLYGEYPDDFGSGGIDLLPELFVGRIPCRGDVTQLDQILRKTVQYESSQPGDWTTRCLLATRALDKFTPGYHLGEAVRRAVTEPSGLSAIRAYDDRYGLDPPPDHYPCTYDAVRHAWSGGAGVVLWLTHGSTTDAAGVISSDRCAELDDSRPSIVYQGSCSNGLPEDPGNLAYALLCSGAVSTVAASRAAWYYIGETNYQCSDSVGGFGYAYASCLVGRSQTTGQALASARLNAPMSLWANHLVLNLFGDPSLRLNRPALGEVVGTVHTVGGRPVEGARIEVADGTASAISDVQGEFVVRGLVAGPHDILISRDGFHPQRYYAVTVTPAGKVRLDVTLVGAGPGSIAGRVHDTFRSPLEKAVITLKEDGRGAVSMGDGTFFLADVPSGAYTVVVDRPPFAQKVVGDCVVSEGQLTELDITLETRVGNVLRNGSFELTAPDGSALYWRDIAEPDRPAAFAVGTDVRRYGLASQKVVLSPGQETGAGVCQTVDVVPGVPYSLVAWARTHCEGPDKQPDPGVLCYIGYDQAGGTDVSSPTVTWRVLDPAPDVWQSVFTEVIPYAPTMTVFLGAQSKHKNAGECTAWFDGVSLRGPVQAPPVPIVHASGRYQSDAASVRAQWSCPDADVVSFDYAVSTTPDDSGIVPGGDWRGVGNVDGATREGLALGNGDLVRALVRSRDSNGIVSEIGASEPVRIVEDLASIAEVKSRAGGTWVRIPGLCVSRMGQGPECFAQDLSRVAGIRVTGDWPKMPYLRPGTLVTVVGRLEMDAGLPTLRDGELLPSVTLSPPRPLAMLSRCITRPTSGATSNGLLVTVVGRVVDAEVESLTLDDGSLRGGLRVDCFNSAAPPPVGALVRITGISRGDSLSVYRLEDVVEFAEH